jgi:predicted RNA-binding protein Jag
MNEQVQNQLNGRGNIVTIKKASTENQTTTDFMTLDRSIHSSMIGLEGKLYLNRVFNTGDSKIVVDISNIDKYQIVETLDIPLALNENKYGLTIDKINSATLQHSQGDNIKVFLSEPYDASTSSVKSYLYTYNIVQNKKVSLTKYDMANIMDNVEWTFDCKKDFERTIIIPEKPPKPKVPEIFSPKRYNKKARAEADQINAERQKKFLQELDEYSKQLTDNSGYSVNLFLNNNGTKTLIKKFEGTMGIALYEDQFVFYADELEYVMYDITKDQIIWSIPK